MGGERKTQVVLADYAVAYLPIWLAAKFDPWITLDDGRRLSFSGAFLPWRIPSTVDNDEETIGDRGCLNALLTAFSEGQPSIGVCDPCEIPVMGKESELVIVGGLIKDAPFWCLAHSEIASASRPAQLNATHIAMHESGFATGFYIGHDVAAAIRSSQNNRAPNIAVGSVGDIVDGARWWIDRGQHRVAAISASVLSAALALEETTNLRVAFALHDLPKFQNFLTTGIVVHRKFLEDPLFRDHVRLFLFGIMFAHRYMVNTREATIQDIIGIFNRQDFERERRVKHTKIENGKIIRSDDSSPRLIGRSEAEFIYETLVQTRDIYSADCEITREQWQKAWFGTRAQSCANWPRLADVMDDAILKGAQRTFNERMATESLKHNVETLESEVSRLKAKLFRSEYLVRLAAGLFLAFVAGVGSLQTQLIGTMSPLVQIACALAVTGSIFFILRSERRKTISNWLLQPTWLTAFVFFGGIVLLALMAAMLAFGGYVVFVTPAEFGGHVITVSEVESDPTKTYYLIGQWCAEAVPLAAFIFPVIATLLWARTTSAFTRLGARIRQLKLKRTRLL